MMIKITNQKIKNNKISFFLIFLFLTPFLVQGAYLIRDAETEDYLRQMLDEILVAANLSPKSINLFLIQDDDINAFVYGGSNMVVNTGLIQSFDSYRPIQAVLAHETGHIKASHFLGFSMKAEQAMLEALFYSVPGALLVIGAAPIMVPFLIPTFFIDIASKRILSYSRMQESEADYYAFQFLTNIKSSKDGMIEVFEIFKNAQDAIISPSKAEAYQYSTTHPFASERLKFFERKFASIKYSPIERNDLDAKHLMVTAKLAGSFDNLRLSFSQKFAYNPRAIMYYSGFIFMKRGDLKKAESIFFDMLKDDPKNPYLYEVLSNIAYKNEDYTKAAKLMHKALELKPKEFVFLFELGEIYKKIKDFSNAEKYMELAGQKEPYNPKVPFELASIYSMKGEDGPARLYFIESEILKKNYKKARILFAAFKAKNFTLEKRFQVKAEDIEFFLRNK